MDIEWNEFEKSCIFTALQQYYSDSSAFAEIMTISYNKVVITHPVHTTEAGKHFNMLLINDTRLQEKPRSGLRKSSTLHGYLKNVGGAIAVSKITEIINY